MANFYRDNKDIDLLIDALDLTEVATLLDTMACAGSKGLKSADGVIDRKNAIIVSNNL